MVGRIGDYSGIPILLSRTGYTAELGYEVWSHPKDATSVWDAVCEPGQPYGLNPLGLGALDTLRIEADLVFAGYEFDDQIDPFEAGIGFTVALKSKAEEDFIGKEALIGRKEHPNRVLVGRELEGDEVATHGDCVHIGENQVGIITGSTRSPILRKNIAVWRSSIPSSDQRWRSAKLMANKSVSQPKLSPFHFTIPKKKLVRS